jgi:xylose isomerase
MYSKIKFSTGFGTFGNHSDRFCTSGYKFNKSTEEIFADASKVEYLSGLELVGMLDVSEKNVDLIKELKERYNLDIVSITVDIFGKQIWRNGSFSSSNLKTRKKAIEEVKNSIDIASYLNCKLINIWPGQDGYDYTFQADYIKAWGYLIDGIKECAEYKSDMKISIEYKPKEPRTHCYIGTVGKTLALLNNINKDNVGVTIDVGHALYAYENVAESIAICKLFGDKLFHIHLNDNYRYWDDDMMVGSVHIIEYIELIYWLKRIGYKGYYSLDIFPYREDGIGAANESIEWLRKMINIVKIIEENGIDRLLEEGNPVKTASFLRKFILK